MIAKIRQHRLLIIVIGIAVAVGASLPPLMTASCQQPRPGAEARALESLRLMTRGGVLPSEDVVAKLESDYPRSRVAALARLVRARIKLGQKDFSGAATLLDSSVIANHSQLGDYALLMRADALIQAGQTPNARAAYERLRKTYPASSRAQEAILEEANLQMRNAAHASVPQLLNELAASDNAEALLLTAKAHEEMNDNPRAIAAYRRLYFFAPQPSDGTESSDAASALGRLGSSTSPSNSEEAIARADRLYEAKRYGDALAAYNDAFNAYPATATIEAQLRKAISAATVRRVPDASAAANAIPASAGEIKAEALFHLAQANARVRQWEQARATVDELRRTFPNSPFTPRAMVSVGMIANEAKNSPEATNWFRTAVNGYKTSIEVAQAQFELAWDAHEAKNFAESSQQLTEHLAYYADKNTDNRGRAGYWAARDSERAGKLSEARALYEAMLGRYDANWYGYLAKQRLDAMGANVPAKRFGPETIVGRAIANLQTVTVAEETAGPKEELAVARAEELNIVGLDDWALEELDQAYRTAGNSPKVNLAIARVYRSQEDNVRALNTLRRSFPDYSQMKPEEMTPEEWDVFYPLTHWDIIVQESKAKNLDPYQVAGLIRQETVFMSRAKSSARAYGLMQVLIPTATLVARKVGVNRTINEEALYEPRLNVQLGTAYMREQIDRFGRIEYVAAAYNAGPHRMAQWRSLPGEIDEWAEAVPFRETRGYIQGVVRNRLQYQRLYDSQGRFKPEVGRRAVTKRSATSSASPGGTDDPTIQKGRVTGNENGG